MKSTYTEAYRAFLVRLVNARKAAGLTQAELANRLGRPQSFVSKIESGERRVDVVELLELSRAIGLSHNVLLEGLEP